VDSKVSKVLFWYLAEDTYAQKYLLYYVLKCMYFRPHFKYESGMNIYIKKSWYGPHVFLENSQDKNSENSESTYERGYAVKIE